MREEVPDHVTMENVVKVSWIELKAPDGRFWRFPDEASARKFANENGLQITGGNGHG